MGTHNHQHHRNTWITTTCTGGTNQPPPPNVLFRPPPLTFPTSFPRSTNCSNTDIHWMDRCIPATNLRWLWPIPPPPWSLPVLSPPRPSGVGVVLAADPRRKNTNRTYTPNMFQVFKYYGGNNIIIFGWGYVCHEIF